MLINIGKLDSILETLKIESKKIEIKENTSDITSYLCFLDYFSGIREIKREHLIIGAHFTYGWMPTIFGRYENNSFNFIKHLDESVEILNKIKLDENIQSLELEDLVILKTCINNSIVGVSKILHFINPQIYAIWDSRVCRYLNNLGLKIKDSPNGYLDYLNLVEEITSLKEYDIIHNEIQSKVKKYKMSKLRTFELVMYILGKN